MTIDRTALLFSSLKAIISLTLLHVKLIVPLFLTKAYVIIWLPSFKIEIVKQLLSEGEKREAISAKPVIG